MKQKSPQLLSNICAILFLQGSIPWAVYGDLPVKCAQLIAGPGQIVSSSEGYINETVHVSCEAGFSLDSGTLNKTIQCINNGSLPTWNDSPGDCIPKECGDLHLGDKMALTDGSAPFVVGDNATITCITGHAFSVNLTLNVSDRVVASQNLTCLDDPTHVEGRWSELEGNCSVIECSSPFEVNNAIMTYTNITYQSTVVYKCYSGRVLGSRSTRIATCTDNAEWDLQRFNVESGTIYCSRRSDYVGCVPSTAISVRDSYTTATLDAADCIGHCRSNVYRFAALSDDTCTCGDGIVSDFDIIDDEFCNVTCAGYDENNLYQTVFCGGTGSLLSVYVTIDGCYENITVNMDDAEEVLAEEEHTCNERCRAKDFAYAAIFNTTCFCLNATQIDGVKADSGYCEYSETPQYLDVKDLAKYEVTAENCSTLYNSGIRMHGRYMLKNGTKTFCNFKDGTVCDEEWIGYDGNCYLFNGEVRMNFSAARDFCIGNEAELVSILSAGEAQFLKETRNLFSDFQDRMWYIGMVDSHNTSLFDWVDGNLFSYSRFGETEPSGHGLCMKDGAEKYNWLSIRCSARLNVICKKSKSLYQCVNTDISEAVYTRNESTMYLPYCVELCRGQATNYSAVSGGTCYCYSRIPDGTVNLSLRNCGSPCPGDPYQYCGGDEENHTLIEVPGRLPARSCEDLQLFGIGNGSFVIRPENDTILQTCATPECPYAWLEIRGRCYRFNPLKTNSTGARKFCSRYDAYPVVLETDQEVEELMDTVTNISVYSSTLVWRIGLQSLSESSGLYRWANGKVVTSDFWSNNFTVHKGAEVLVPKGNHTEWQAVSVGDAAFLCEKGQNILDYLGCYDTSVTVWDYNTTEYDQMTIQQCVEWCRSGGKQHAFLGESLCTCSDTLPEHAEEGVYCYSACSGQQNQICGGDGVMSAYNISEYEGFASQCYDLTDSSVFLSGTYVIGGETRYCNFSDSVLCDEGWIGNGMDCYRFFPVVEIYPSDWWYDNNIVTTSVTTANEETFLVYYLQRLYLGYNSGKIVTGLRDNYHLRIFTHQDGMLFQPDLLSSGYPESNEFTSNVGFKTDGFSLSQKGDALGWIGKKDRYKIGCYVVPSWMSPVLSNFSSMELTLCKQLCLARGAEVALMTLDSCFCGNSSLITTLTPANDETCKNTCQVHPWQWCGDGTNAIAYNVVADEAHLSTDCITLYQSGVFFNTTYKLWNGHNMTLKTCGFTDDTVCPATWFGREGQCFKLFIIPKTINIARLSCFVRDAYLFNPIKDSPVWTLLEYIRSIPVLNETDNILSGIRTVFFNNTYVTSSGTRLDPGDIPDITLDRVPQNYVKMMAKENAWENYNSDEELPYMCQTDKGKKNKAVLVDQNSIHVQNDFNVGLVVLGRPSVRSPMGLNKNMRSDYLGCCTVHTVPDILISDIVDISLTMCKEYCRGQEATYFATSNVSCLCFNTKPHYTSQKGKCDIPCPGADTQPCGGNDNETVLFSLFRISDFTIITFAKSCAELAQYGIWYPGEYYIQPDSTTWPFKVTCFHLPPPITLIDKDMFKEIAVSSSETDFDTSKTFQEYGLHEVWKPKTSNVNQQVKLSLKQIHIFTGFILQGVHKYDDISYVTKIKISFTDPLSDTLVDYTEKDSAEVAANSNGIDSSYIFLAKPFIAKKVIVSPLEWHNSIALKVIPLGQVYKYFSHDDFFIGCVLDISGMFNYFSSGAQCVDVDRCAAENESFLLLDNNGTCYCGFKAGTNDSSAGFRYGFVNGMCPLNGTKYIGHGNLYKALYRTYEKKCMSPTNITDGQSPNMTYPYVDDVFTYGATALYECDTGYEFNDGSPNVITACRQDNSWDNITQACSIISCPSFNVTNGVVHISSLEYLSEANVLCDHGNWAENGMAETNVTCEATKKWTITPTCNEYNLKKNIRHFSSYGKLKRDPTDMTVEFSTRSSLECTVTCTTTFYCKGANFKRTTGTAGTCRMFTVLADPEDLSDNIKWKYYETFTEL